MMEDNEQNRGLGAIRKQTQPKPDEESTLKNSAEYSAYGVNSILSPEAKIFVPQYLTVEPERSELYQEDFYCYEEEDIYVDKYTIVRMVKTCARMLMEDPACFNDLIDSYTSTFYKIAEDSNFIVQFVESLFTEILKRKDFGYMASKVCATLCQSFHYEPIGMLIVSKCECIYKNIVKKRYLSNQHLLFIEFFCEFTYAFHEATPYNQVLNFNIMIYNLIFKILQDLTLTNITVLNKVMKLMGRFLKVHHPSDFEKLMSEAEKTALSLHSIPKLMLKLNEIIAYVKNIDITDYEQSDESQGASESSTVYYGPDGMPLSQDEIAFAISQLTNDHEPEVDAILVPEDPHFTEEMCLEFENFLNLK